jgi:integrase-like protein
MNMHRSRHTFATEVRKVTKDSGTLQHLLGHTDVSTTIGTYGHVDFSDLEGAMDALASRRSVPHLGRLANGLNKPEVEAAGIEPASADAPIEHLRA